MIKYQTTYKELVDKLAPERHVGHEIPVDLPVYVRSPDADGFTRILAVIEKDRCPIQKTTFTDGRSFESSTRHLFFDEGVPVTAEEATLVDVVSGGQKQIRSKEIVAEETVFDISVPAPYKYIADDSGIIHHNTFLAIGACKNFLEHNPDGIVVYFETEGAISKDMLVQRGVDVKRMAIVPVITVQQLQHQAVKIIDNYEKEKISERRPLFFVLDSLGMLSTDKEIGDASEAKSTVDMTRAKLIKATFRILTLRMSRANIPMFVTNHIYADMGGGPYAASVQSGGTGAVYAGSTILTATKAKDKDSDGSVGGVIVTLTATKSRLTRENSRVKCRIRYTGGLDRYHGLLELAEEAGIFKKVSTRYELPDGTKIFGKQIMNNPETYFTDEVLEQINAYVSRKFKYGSGEDEMDEPNMLEQAEAALEDE